MADKITEEAAEYLKEHKVYEKLHSAILTVMEHGCPDNPLQILKEHFLRGEKLRLIIDGPPASGKGTHAQYIKEHTGVVHISTGTILRQEVSAGSELGRTVKKFMDAGKLVPDDIMIKVVAKRLAAEDCVAHGWLLDGFPRTHAQARALKAHGFFPNLYILLTVSDDECVRRVTGRRVDPETGDVYHVDFNPPPPEVASRVQQRPDDNEEVIRRRLRIYSRNSTPVHEEFRSVLREVDGSLSIEATKDSVREVLVTANTHIHPKTREVYPRGLDFEVPAE